MFLLGKCCKNILTFLKLCKLLCFKTWFLRGTTGEVLQFFSNFAFEF
ncbi:hypothetical protein HMPREF9554_00927 [Treponema phagedenis F0421]|nr:hypothetical protein HMPREF9554_00927 [Treponema phagedenis F0421]